MSVKLTDYRWGESEYNRKGAIVYTLNHHIKRRQPSLTPLLINKMIILSKPIGLKTIYFMATWKPGHEARPVVWAFTIVESGNCVH